MHMADNCRLSLYDLDGTYLSHMTLGTTCNAQVTIFGAAFTPDHKLAVGGEYFGTPDMDIPIRRRTADEMVVLELGAEHHFVLILAAFLRIVRFAPVGLGDALFAAGRFLDSRSFLIKALMSLRSSAVSSPPAMTRSTSSGSSLWRISVRLEIAVDQRT